MLLAEIADLETDIRCTTRDQLQLAVLQRKRAKLREMGRLTMSHNVNADIIAAAPELLAACQKALRLGGTAHRRREVNSDLRAAIAKATGVSPRKQGE